MLVYISCAWVVLYILAINSGGKARMKTFQDLMSGGGSEDEDEESENYFAGGEKSGVFMKGGPKKGAASPGQAADLVKEILEKAAE